MVRAPQPSIVPYLTVRDAKATLAFCEQAFGAETLAVMEDDAGVYHARMRIGDGLVMMYEERTGPLPGNDAPATLGGSPVAIRLDMGSAPAVDATFARAVALGAAAVVAPVDRPWGRLAEVRDAGGHFWRLAATPPEGDA